MEDLIYDVTTNRWAAKASGLAVARNPQASESRLFAGKVSPAFVKLLVGWHLLSLDAATVAVVWVVAVAWMSGIRLPFATPVALGLGAWMLYAGDRLLDGWSGETNELETRHLFHWQHRWRFVAGLAVAAGVMAVLLPMLPAKTMRLYTFEGALVAGYFLLIHVGHEGGTEASADGDGNWSRRDGWLPKELFVGPFFAAAVFVPTLSSRPEMIGVLAPLAVLFAGVCTLNCLYIYAWEHPDVYRATSATRYSVARLPWITGGLAAASAACFAVGVGEGREVYRLFSLACAGSVAGLVVVDAFRGRLGRVTLRAMADAVLLTPLLVLPFAGRG